MPVNSTDQLLQMLAREGSGESSESCTRTGLVFAAFSDALSANDKLTA